MNPLVRKLASIGPLTSDLVKAAERASKRLGRGGQGATGGRGRKGWKARHGKARPIPAFTGGQTSLLKAFPKFGAASAEPNLRILSLDTLQHWINLGRIDPDRKITIKEICSSGVCGKVKDGVVLLGNGLADFNAKVDIQVTRASQTAIEKIESLGALLNPGGSISTVYHSREAIRAMLNPHKYSSVPEQCIPHSRALIARYIDPVRRGYLAGKAQGVKPEQILSRIRQL